MDEDDKDLLLEIGCGIFIVLGLIAVGSLVWEYRHVEAAILKILAIIAVAVCFGFGLLYGTSPKFRHYWEAYQERKRLEGEALRERWRLKEEEKKEKLRLERLKPRTLLVEEEFEQPTPAGFNVCYKLHGVIETPNADEFDKLGLEKAENQKSRLQEFHQTTFREFFRDKGYRFYFDSNNAEAHGQGPLKVSVGTAIVCQRDDKIYLRNVDLHDVEKELGELRLEKESYKVTAGKIETNIWPDELVERNYAMLTDEQKTAVESDEKYNALEEAIAVAALHRQMEFQRSQHIQTHDSEMFIIKTEQVGRALKLSWQFKPNAPGGYDLIGYRRTGGFHPDQWDIEKNGPIVVQTRRDGEIMEFLEEGETYFYTFTYRHFNLTAPGASIYPVARFRIKMATDETDRIEATIRRLKEARTPQPIQQIQPVQAKEVDPDLEYIAQAVREFMRYAKFETLFDDLVKKVTDVISKGDYSDAEKEKKIWAIQDVAASVRDKYGK
jgi:hypothetical protein